MLYIEDEYTAFCLNQACAYIRVKMEQEEEMPTFEKHYSNFSDLYKEYDT